MPGGPRAGGAGWRAGRPVGGRRWIRDIIGGWRPGRTSGAEAKAPRPARITSPRPPRWRSSLAAATRSTPRWRAGSSCRWWSRTCAGRAARCPPCSSRPTTRPRACSAGRGLRRSGPPPRCCATSWALRRSPAPACSRPPSRERGTAGSRSCATTARFRWPTSSAPLSATRPTGFPLVPRVSSAIAAVEQHFREHWPSSATTWLPDGRVPTATHRLPALAATWRKLLAAAVGPTREAQIDAARDAWYRGFVAEEIERFVATPVRDATGRDHAGLLSADDLAAWSSSYEDALVVEVGGGWAVAKPGPWSQGPVLAQTLQLLRGADLTYADGVPTEATAHLVAEAAKLAFADREAWYGDSAPVPLDVLVSCAYADERRALIDDAASLELRPGSPAGVPPRLAAATAPGGARGDGVSSAGLGEPTAARAPGLGEPTAAGPRPTAGADARSATREGAAGLATGSSAPAGTAGPGGTADADVSGRRLPPGWCTATASGWWFGRASGRVRGCRRQAGWHGDGVGVGTAARGWRLGLAASCRVPLRGPPGRAPRRVGRGAANRASGRMAWCGVTPCTSTSSTPRATWSRRPRPAGGCSRRRRSRHWASASAPAGRCSGWRTGWRRR